MSQYIDNESSIFDLPTGTRVVIRSKSDWRSAAIAKRNDDRVTLTVASPTGRNYRIQITAETNVSLSGRTPQIRSESNDNWNENLAKYDRRW